jgi:hypothetical protein
MKCVDCLGDFYPPTLHRKTCDECRKRREVDSNRLRDIYRHGVSRTRFEELFLAGCAICGKPFKETPHIDHDHRHCSGRYGCRDCFRGLLCRFCNNGFIYALENNPSLRNLVSQSVLDYVDKIKEPRQTSSPSE